MAQWIKFRWKFLHELEGATTTGQFSHRVWTKTYLTLAICLYANCIRQLFIDSLCPVDSLRG